jgi:hypothetical protein
VIWLIPLITFIVTIAVCWLERAMTRREHAKLNDFIANGPPPSLYEHWDERRRANQVPTMATVLASQSYLEDCGRLGLRYGSIGGPYGEDVVARWRWKDDAGEVWRYLDAVDGYVRSGNPCLIPQIEEAAEPLFDGYEEFYAERRAR